MKSLKGIDTVRGETPLHSILLSQLFGFDNCGDYLKVYYRPVTLGNTSFARISLLDWGMLCISGPSSHDWHENNSKKADSTCAKAWV
jgi:hypothetical protein